MSLNETEGKMDKQSRLPSESSRLDEAIKLTSKALAEASYRLAAMEERGTIHDPGLQDWVLYVQELEKELLDYLRDRNVTELLPG